VAARPDQEQCLVQRHEYVLRFVGRYLHQAASLCPLRLDAALLGEHHFLRDTALVVELQELLLLILKRPQPPRMLLGLLARNREPLPGLLPHTDTDRLALISRQHH
jgi:hypothetical protein